MDDIHIRPLTIEDGEIAASIFFDAVHRGTREHYTLEQRQAWAGTTADSAGWRNRLVGMDGFVAEMGGCAVGFMTLDDAGYIDLAFVRPEVAGKGVGWRLYRTIERLAEERGATRLTAHASKTARPFFERQGWIVDRQQSVVRRNVELINFKMSKELAGHRKK
ncbi:MAG TPA: GNAT family N-acetyltransferase [Sphingomonadaceae bacterium]|nr:GNAT family N-acetyltransferase [Sphingomonadaceae bacterium]